MPKRSNTFQRLIKFLHKYKTPDVEIIESCELKERISGEKREVDICLKSKVGDYSIIISIECIDKTRKADKPWVEMMKAKHEKLETNSLVLVSKKGFYKPALDLCKEYGIKAYTIEEVENSKSIYSVKTLNCKIDKVNILLLEQNGSIKNVATVPINDIYNKNSEIIANVFDLVTEMLNNKHVSEKFLLEGTEEHDRFIIRWDNKHEVPIYMKKVDSSELDLIKAIVIQGCPYFNIKKIDTQSGKFGELAFVYGETSLNSKNMFFLGIKEGNEETINVYTE